MQRRYPRPGILQERSRVRGRQWSLSSNPAYFCWFHLTLLQVTSLPQNHRPKITLEKNTLGCKHRRVALKSPGLARSGSSEAVVGPSAALGPQLSLPRARPAQLCSCGFRARVLPAIRFPFKGQGRNSRHSWVEGMLGVLGRIRKVDR